MFGVENVRKEYENLLKQGVKFTVVPTEVRKFIIVVLDYICGNFIQIV